jgi:hypothetical protein
MKRSMDKAVREPTVSVYALQLGIEVNFDSGLLDHIQEPLLDGACPALLALVGSLAAELNGMSTKKPPFFHQFHGDIQPGQFPGGCEAGDATTDDQDLLGCITGRTCFGTVVQK